MVMEELTWHADAHNLRAHQSRAREDLLGAAPEVDLTPGTDGHPSAHSGRLALQTSRISRSSRLRRFDTMENGMATTSDERIQRLEDLFAIQQVLGLYCRAVDRLDIELLRSVYHPDATDAHGTFVGNAFEFVEYAMSVLARNSCTSHSISNPVIDLDGDVASVESIYRAYTRVPGGWELRQHLLRRDVRRGSPGPRRARARARTHLRRPVPRPLRAPRRRVANRGAEDYERVEPVPTEHRAVGRPARGDAATRQPRPPRSRVCEQPPTGIHAVELVTH
jgi:hypothetical protein